LFLKDYKYNINLLGHFLIAFPLKNIKKRDIYTYKFQINEQKTPFSKKQFTEHCFIALFLKRQTFQTKKEESVHIKNTLQQLFLK